MLGELFPGGVVTREVDPNQLVPGPEQFEEELAAIANAVSKRRCEYLAVRQLARQALGQLGVAPQAILNRPDRSPIWPDGIVGSLSHTKGWCGVAVAHRGSACLGIGVDAEAAYEMSPQVVERVLTTYERESFAGLTTEALQSVATLVFSAKEAVYKCIYPHLGRFVGFEEVEIRLFDLEERGAFKVVFTGCDLLAPVIPGGYELDGRFARKGNLWLTGVTLAGEL